MNICKNCKHGAMMGVFTVIRRCRRPVGEIDVVSGENTRHLDVPCEQERKSGECGIDGKFFERYDPFGDSRRAPEPREDAKSEYYRAKAALYWSSRPTGSDF